MKCEICGKECKGLQSLSYHLSKSHNLKSPEEKQQYFNKYGKPKKEQINKNNDKIICKICNREFNGNKFLAKHISYTHKISTQQYYDTYIKKENEGLCQKCNNPAIFISLSKGYYKYCNNCKANTSYMICKICGLSTNKLQTHLNNTHKIIDYKNYYNLYIKSDEEGLCKKCGNITEFISIGQGYKPLCHNCSHNITQLTCKICGKTLNITSKHFTQIHNISSKEYYDTYLKKENEGICPVCNKPTPFISVIDGYQKHCSCKCSQINENTLNNFRYNNPQQNEEIHNKTKETNLKKYNSEFGLSNSNVRKKIQDTCLERYNTKHVIATPMVRQKSKETLLNKLGVENCMQNEDIKNKMLNKQRENHNGVLAWNTPEQRDAAWKTRHQNNNLDNEINDADE